MRAMNVVCEAYSTHPADSTCAKAHPGSFSTLAQTAVASVPTSTALISLARAPYEDRRKKLLLIPRYEARLLNGQATIGVEGQAALG